MKSVDSMENLICSSCGLCEGVCPVEAVELKEDGRGFPRPITNRSCIKCGKCAAACPHGMGGDNLTGECGWRDYSQYVYGHSMDESLRKKAASGGITTELLTYLLDTKIVDYVITSGSYFNGHAGGGILLLKIRKTYLTLQGVITVP